MFSRSSCPASIRFKLMQEELDRMRDELTRPASAALVRPVPFLHIPEIQTETPLPTEALNPILALGSSFGKREPASKPDRRSKHQSSDSSHGGRRCRRWRSERRNRGIPSSPLHPPRRRAWSRSPSKARELHLCKLFCSVEFLPECRLVKLLSVGRRLQRFWDP